MVQSIGKVAAVFARPAEIILGLVFLTGAFLKAIEINLFITQVGHYGVLPGDSPLTVVAALGTLGVETLLGSALLLGWRLRGAILAVVAALLLAFTALIAYGWAFHDLQDCGCFGRLEMSPGISMLKNAGLGLLCAMAWAGLAAKGQVFPGQASSSRPALRRGGIAKAVVCVCLSAVLAAYAASDIEASPEEYRPFAQFVFEADGELWDLGQGEYIVAMLNATCEHCMASVERLNELALLPELPPVIGLCEGTEESIEEFRLATGPQFPLQIIGIRTFYGLIENSPPRFYVVRDGEALVGWDEEVPEPEIILGALSEGDASGN